MPFWHAALTGLFMTRYGDRHGVTATSITGFWLSVLWCRYLQRLFFSGGGVSRGAGDKVAAGISQPGGAKLSDQRANAPRLCASGNFGSGYAGLDDYTAKPFIFAKIFRRRVWSISPYLLLWP